MREIIIPVEERIASDFNGYEKFIQTYEKIKKIKDSKIIFDFSKNQWLEANLCSIFGAMIELIQENNNIIEFKGLSIQLHKILSRNGFLSLLNKDKFFDVHNTILSYQRYKPEDDEIFIEYLKRELLSKPDFPKHSEKLGKKIIESIFELYENARTHGKCKYIHVCGQYFPNKSDKPLHITIVDRGISIRKNVNAFFKTNSISGKDAISWAMKKDNTTKIGTPGGLGLDLILEFVMMNNGKIQIISSNGYWEYSKNGDVTESSFRFPFVGTIVNIRFNLNDSNYYQLIEEVNLDISNLF